jgi:hypothetical protein
MMARIELTFVSDFAFSPDGKILAVVGRDHASVLLLDLAPAQSGELFDAVTVTPTLTPPTEAAASPSPPPVLASFCPCIVPGPLVRMGSGARALIRRLRRP